MPNTSNNSEKPQPTFGAPSGPGLPRPGGMGGAGRGPYQGGVVHAKDVKGTLARLWYYLRANKRMLIIVILLVAVSTGLQLIGPYLQGVAIDQFISVGNSDGLARLVLIMFAAYVGAAIATWGNTYLVTVLAQQTVFQIRGELFAHLQQLSLRYFDSSAHGDLMSRVTNDVQLISDTLGTSVTQLVQAVLQVVGTAIMMFIIEPLLAVVALLVVPMMLGVTVYIARHTKTRFRDQQSTMGVMNGLIEETLSGEQVVKAFSKEEEVIADFEVRNVAYREAAIKAQTFSLLMMPLMTVITNLGLALVAGTGGYMVVMGLSTVGTIVAFVTYARQLSEPLRQVANLWNQVQSAIAGAERVFEVMDEDPDLKDSADAREMGQVEGEVIFDNVCFAYKKGVPILKNVSLHAEPGQTVALVGPTGAGKTTIINLLTRFYDIDSGSITIDGVELCDLKKADLRRKLGIVLQDTFLFSDTVMANIRYGRLDATDEEVYAAAQLANADAFIRHLPEGYNTVLSERGGNLSQGQRQLLAIARAMLANPSILILDEATSSVDTRTEANIQEALLKLMKGRTSFVIAHRLSTIRDADQVLVINDGRIIEKGNHQQLLAAQGFYYNLYMSQFKGRKEAFTV